MEIELRTPQSINAEIRTGGGNVISVNGKVGNVVLDYEDVGALSDETVIPTKTSELTNDSGFLTEHQSLSAYRTSAAQDVIDATKQGTLTAGTNIDITNNVVSMLTNSARCEATLISDNIYTIQPLTGTIGTYEYLNNGSIIEVTWPNNTKSFPGAFVLGSGFPQNVDMVGNHMINSTYPAGTAVKDLHKAFFVAINGIWLFIYGNVTGTNTIPGQLKLFDGYGTEWDVNNGTAATPKSVYNSLVEAKGYSDTHYDYLLTNKLSKPAGTEPFAIGSYSLKLVNELSPASVEITSGSATVNSTTFIAKAESESLSEGSKTLTYKFGTRGDAWYIDGSQIMPSTKWELSEWGITYTGTGPVTGETVKLNYTEGGTVIHELRWVQD